MSPVADQTISIYLCEYVAGRRQVPHVLMIRPVQAVPRIGESVTLSEHAGETYRYRVVDVLHPYVYGQEDRRACVQVLVEHEGVTLGRGA